MTKPRDTFGIVLGRNEIWLLLNALATAPLPPLGWDGQPPEPWEVGELQAKLRDALQPDPVRGIEEQPVIAMDSQMGQDLAAAGIRPLVVPHSYDIGSLLAACAERGWGAEIELPRGAIPRTPAMATVCTRRDRGQGRPDEATYVGLERPVVALARAMIGALVGARSAEDLEAEGILIPPRPGRDELGRVRTRTGDSRRYDEYVIHGSAIGRGQKERVVKRMARQGWEVVVDEGEGPNDLLIFRRPKPLGPESETPEAAHH